MGILGERRSYGEFTHPLSIASLTTALCLPALEIEALLQGRMIVAASHTFRNPLQFVLCPAHTSDTALPVKECYRASFLRSVKAGFTDTETQQTTLRAWASFSNCRIYNAESDLEALSKLTVWKADYLTELARRQHKLFLMTLQVHRFEQPATIAMPLPSEDKIGRYIRLPHAPADRSGDTIISKVTFNARKKQLFDLSPPLHPELEDLQSALAQVRESGLGAMSLDRDLRYFLGWSHTAHTKLDDSDLVWIQQIAQTGNSNDGEAFARLTRQSLIKLGFSNSNTYPKASLDPSATEGAGGIDVYCEAPYPLVGECKASQYGSIPNGVTAQLIHLGNTHLPANTFERSVKVLFVAGSLSSHAQQAAIGNNINVMRPETLQRLTELQAQHPGSIDLYKLKPCLQLAPFGEEADTKVNLFIDNIVQQLEVRAELIRAVKNCLQNTGEDSVGTDAVFFAYAANAPQANLPQLNRQAVQETLIELSSPLAGYLGRENDTDALADRHSHRFYFLRELHLEHGALSAVR